MAKSSVKHTHLVLGTIYICDGVYMSEIIYSGSKANCERYADKMYGDLQYSDIEVVTAEEFYSDPECEDEEKEAA